MKETNPIYTTCAHPKTGFNYYPEGTFSGYHTYIFHYGAGSVASCSYIPGDRRVDTGYADGRDIGDVTYYHQVQTGEEIIGYSIGCGKTEETQEGYKVIY